MKPPSTLLPPPVTAPGGAIEEERAVAGAGKSAREARGADGDVAARKRIGDRVRVLADEPADQAERAAADVTARRRSVIVPRLVATSPPAIFEAVVELESPTLTVAAELESAMTPLF